MSSPRSARLIAVATVMTSLAVCAPYGTATAASADATVTARDSTTATAWAGELGKEPTSLTELRREAQKAYKSIEDANRALVARQKKFGAVEKELVAKLESLQQATAELNKMRKPLSDLASSLYQDPSVDGLSPFFRVGNGTDTLRRIADLDHLVAGRNNVLGDAIKLLERQQQLAQEAQELRAASLLQEAQLSAQVTALRKRSSTLVRSLTRALIKLGVKIGDGTQGAGGCDPTRITQAEQYPNGLLPKNILCPLPQGGETLRADAAIAFADLNIAYKKRFGTSICISDSYRSLSEQQSVYYRRPGFAATPGKSNHGLGLAVDLCGGVQNFRSAQFNWLEANGKRFGWFHPAWAYSSPFEPWHWEYDPKLGSLL
ncbi:D-alanyl-D-alanine carboxypeptidase family protein [Microbispora sp. H10836]|uniref:D-alanyl-D-alanine carboxypeptidase family protein n=1 Tax=Microbispora sp. H10836 TaxID=2729106 RepID=UPI001473680F|nr:D-alanyl-D-alanine carboxypeptidase family protein [Microbispora sp. H10836]